ncbi:MAG: AAC(3) family N-acetyltransferase [Oscillospiraceae bacterium]|nr:AAC(3) family N-acetyltransferase [Oscillospiraceae bacterium]
MGRYDDIMQNTKKPSTITTIIANLRKLGIVNGDILLVHSSLSSMGFVIGGYEAVVWALLQAVGEDGTLIMPSQTMQNSDPTDYSKPAPIEQHELWRRAMLPYNPLTTPTCGMGIIAETFRTFPNTLRSNHPQTSFCANGKYAQRITEEHVLTPQFGMNTPLGKMYNLKTKVLLLGVDYNVCTCLHMSETLSGAIPNTYEHGAVVMKDGKREWVWFNDIDYDTDFRALGKAFEEKHNVTKGKIGQAKCKIFQLNEIVDFGIEWIKNNKKS